MGFRFESACLEFSLFFLDSLSISLVIALGFQKPSPSFFLRKLWRHGSDELWVESMVSVELILVVVDELLCPLIVNLLGL